ncbi:hypothetical protein GIB67_024065 [Kingdonia uniflora]|uniref:Protein kinase domain-containing protein n=1 Tax=Kingdonia uniflora TaxID=39325 RepID=A0A7J7LUT3_9MAGN|nr:hypothetical protein GIB67_024065 [Kingdonia uniflora]
MPSPFLIMAVIVIVIMIVSLFCDFVNWICCQESQSTTDDQTQTITIYAQTVERFLDDMAKEKPIRFSPLQLESFTGKYSRKLGSGGFGIVYKGKYPNGVELAVKVLNSSATEEVKEQFMAEVRTIGRTYHKNLVRLYGFCFDANLKALVYEYMENGSLDSILFYKNKSIEWEKLHKIAIGAAKGLEYLHHSCEDIIIHYDIKPGNVLLDSNFSAKVADFGLAKLCDRDRTHVTMSGGRGTPGYAAPELWMPFPITYKCDVYSYGMMLFEIALGKKNLDITMSESQQWLPIRVWEKLERGELCDFMGFNGVKDEDITKASLLCTVALWCVQYFPEARPSMIKVVQMLEGSVEVTTPPNPFQHLSSSGIGLAVCSQTTEGISENSYKDSTHIMKKYEIELAISS